MKTVSGFSLLEVAIVLAILGIVGSLSLPLITSLYQHQRDQRTEQNFSQITQALAAYVLVHNHLPCPANPAAVATQAGQSEEGSSIGLVPYRTLGLNEAAAKDGYHHWFTYAVVPDLTQPSIHCLMTQEIGTAKESIFCEVPYPMASLNIINDQGQPVLGERTKGDFIAFVLISHGAKGEGAFNSYGYRIPTSNPDKQINAAEDFQFIDRPASSKAETCFNDKVRWVTRNNLMAIYAKNPCQPRNDTLFPLFQNPIKKSCF